jgi:hypothetical protein
MTSPSRCATTVPAIRRSMRFCSSMWCSVAANPKGDEGRFEHGPGCQAHFAYVKLNVLKLLLP